MNDYPKFAYIITDYKFDIKDYDKKIFEFIGNGGNLKNNKITVFFPKLKTDQCDYFYKTKTYQNKDYY
ncbi:MAG: hypothetical protein U9Q80_01825, partial [Bacillota bacterium]|nr:hypothetical protein [Bacillota bacterium]